jgi:hypothetical protein
MKIQNRSGKKEFKILAQNAKYAVVDEGDGASYRYHFGVIWETKNKTFFEIRVSVNKLLEMRGAQGFLEEEIQAIKNSISATKWNQE